MTDRELTTWLESRFDRLMARFDKIDAYMAKLAMKEKLLEGDALMDNQDVCRMLNISKRTLQRYRSSGALPIRRSIQRCFTNGATSRRL